MHGRTDVSTLVSTDGGTDGRTDVSTDVSTDGRTDGRTDVGLMQDRCQDSVGRPSPAAVS